MPYFRGLAHLALLRNPLGVDDQAWRCGNRLPACTHSPQQKSYCGAANELPELGTVVEVLVTFDAL